MSLDGKDYEVLSNVYVESAKTNTRLDRIIELMQENNKLLKRIAEETNNIKHLQI